jgi:hypothetical protein
LLGLDMYTRARHFDEEAVTLKQDLAEVALVYEALDMAFSCFAHHGFRRRKEHQTVEDKQNELGTDLTRL